MSLALIELPAEVIVIHVASMNEVIGVFHHTEFSDDLHILAEFLRAFSFQGFFDHFAFIDSPAGGLEVLLLPEDVIPDDMVKGHEAMLVQHDSPSHDPGMGESGERVFLVEQFQFDHRGNSTRSLSPVVDYEGMIVRNRLFAFFYRLSALASLVVLLVFYFKYYAPAWRLLSYFGPLASLLYCALLFFEVLFNAIDLRRGIRGVPAGVYMPVALSITCFALEGAIGYFVDASLSGSFAPFEIGFYAVLFALPLLDWMLFDEKGTVKLYNAFISQIVPIFYGVFAFFRAIIWPNNYLNGGSLYPYLFLDPHSPWFWPGLAIVFLSLLGFSTLIFFLNSVFSNKYSKWRE